MKAFTYYTRDHWTPWLPVLRKAGEDPYIPVGVEGTRCTLTRVPLPPGALLTPWERVVENVETTKLIGVLGIEECAMLLMTDQSGVRGSWFYWLPAGSTLLAEGFCAQGPDEKEGGGPEILVLVPSGKSITLYRTGLISEADKRIVVDVCTNKLRVHSLP